MSDEKTTASENPEEGSYTDVDSPEQAAGESNEEHREPGAYTDMDKPED